MLTIPKIEVQELDKDRTRWLDLGGVRFRIKLATPRELDAFNKLLRARGIARGRTLSDFDVVDEERFRLEFARAFILDWDGAIEPPTPYTPELGAKAIGAIPDLAEHLLREIRDYQSFLSANGLRPMPS